MTREEAITILEPCHRISSLPIRTALETLAPELAKSEDYFVERARNFAHEFTIAAGGVITIKENIPRETIRAFLHEYKDWLLKSAEWSEEDEN